MCGCLIFYFRNTLRSTKASQLESVDPNEKQSLKLGNDSKDFAFSSLPIKVEIAESAAFNKNGSPDIQQLNNWLTNV